MAFLRLLFLNGESLFEGWKKNKKISVSTGKICRSDFVEKERDSVMSDVKLL